MRALGLFILMMMGCGGILRAWAAEDGEMKPGSNIQGAEIDFGIGLFRELAARTEGKNVFMSPSSIATALRMAREGASGATLEAMQKLLGPSLSTASTGSTASTPGGVTLEIANSLWANPAMRIRPQYIERIERKYDALIRTLAFGTPGASEAINRWVAERTHDKIDKIVGELGADTVLVLVNAIYFKGKWHAPFKKEATADAPFHKAGGGEATVPMMRQSGHFSYKRGEGYQAIRLAYGDVPVPRPEGMPKDRQLPPRPGPIEAIVVLPDATDGLAGLIRGLDGAKWRELLEGFASKEGTIKLPRFKAQYEKDLVETLKRLGMGPAFDPAAADFSRMVEGQGAFISQVKHKAVVEVNEEGTEAAAATAVVMTLTAMPMAPEPPFEMTVDHPFLFAIRDSRSGEVLFMGAIAEPEGT